MSAGVGSTSGARPQRLSTVAVAREVGLTTTFLEAGVLEVLEKAAMEHMLKIEDGARTYEVAEIIDARELARRWHVPPSWGREYTRPDRTDDPIPHVRLGKYIRFEWGSSRLEEWFARRRAE